MTSLSRSLLRFAWWNRHSGCIPSTSQLPQKLYRECFQTRNMFADITLNKDRTETVVSRRGWDFDDFALESDFKPFLKVWRILCFVDWTREYSFIDGLIDNKQLEKTHFTYIKCINLQRKVHYLDFVTLCAKLSGYGITVKTSLTHVGRTSFQLDHSVLHEETGKELFTSSIVYVTVERSSRKVASLPEWWIGIFKTKATGKAEPLRLNLSVMAPPGGVPVVQLPLRVLPGDLDYYNHANNTTYLKYSAEGMLTALHKGIFSKVTTRRSLENATQSIELDYIGDCIEGDLLNTETWEDPEDPCVIWNRVVKGQEVIFVQKINIHPIET